MDLDWRVVFIASAVAAGAWYWLVAQPRRLMRERLPQFTSTAEASGVSTEVAVAVFEVLGRHDLDVADERAFVISNDEEELAESAFLILRRLGVGITLDDVLRVRLAGPKPLTTVHDLLQFVEWLAKSRGKDLPSPGASPHRGVVARLLFWYGCVSAAGAAIFQYVSVTSTGVDLEGHGNVFMALFGVHLVALAVTLIIDPRRLPLPTALPATRGNIVAGRLLLSAAVLNVVLWVGHLVVTRYAGKHLTDEMFAGLLASMLLCTAVYVALHWAFRPENLLPPPVMTVASFLANPWPSIFAGSRRSRDAYRRLTTAERLLLGLMLRESFQGSEALACQAFDAETRVRRLDDDGSLGFLVRPTVAVSDVDDRVPVEARAVDAGGAVVRAVLHVQDGVITELEFYRENGETLDEIPPITHWVVEDWKASAGEGARSKA